MFSTETASPIPTIAPGKLPPCGFDAGDGNLRRYVGNNPTNATDPSGRIIQLYETGEPAIWGHITIVVYDPATGRLVTYEGGGPFGFVGFGGRRSPKFGTYHYGWNTGDPERIPRTTEMELVPSCQLVDDPNAEIARETPMDIVATDSFDAEVASLDAALARLNQIRDYNAFGWGAPNSNSYAHQLLTLAGYYVYPSPWWAPGWDSNGWYGASWSPYDEHGNPKTHGEPPAQPIAGPEGGPADEWAGRTGTPVSQTFDPYAASQPPTLPPSQPPLPPAPPSGQWVQGPEGEEWVPTPRLPPPPPEDDWNQG